MTPMLQSRFGGLDAPLDEQGDCWATAIACLCDFTEEQRDELNALILDNVNDWWNVTHRYVAEHTEWDGIALLPEGDPMVEGLYIVSGRSPRFDFEHCVIATESDEIFWDPHPSGDGLVGPIIDRIALLRGS